jgi:nicotinamide-nucleotide amidase
LTFGRPRCVVVCTGSELVRGDRRDGNGPFLAGEALALGLEPARIVIVGDGEADLETAFREGLAADLCVVSGGLGPTHDDRTVEIVARVAGLELVRDEALEREIEGISRSYAERLRRPYADFRPGVRKQATLPAGAVPLGLAGTAPGFVLETASGAAVVLPGPPAELRRLWPRALETEPVRRVLGRTSPPHRRLLRFFGASESAVAQALAEVGGDGDGVEATICAHDFEIHVDLVADPTAAARADGLAGALRARLERHLFAEDGRSVEELVLDLCRQRRLCLVTAESCTGGLVAARLTSVPGASDVFGGGVVAYANDVKGSLLGVPDALFARHGAVSAEVAEAMAWNAIDFLDATASIAVTGIAGPGGGTAEKPVGLVYLHAVGPDGDRALEVNIPGDRETVRRRAAVTALHLVRRLLAQSRHEGA